MIGLSLVVVMLAVGAGQKPGAPNGCVTCHERLPATTAGGHSFQDWRTSPHGRAGATCDNCHGGDPAATQREAAHRGVYTSRESRSRVYYTRIPTTCGSCHQQELDFFSKSRHYTQLVSTGRGPNCVTCHGSMAIRVLSPGEMETTCSACHNAERRAPATAPVSARHLLVLLQQVEFGIHVTEALAAQSAQARPREAANRELQGARATMRSARQSWHSFDLVRVEETLLQAAAAAGRADSVLTSGGRR